MAVGYDSPQEGQAALNTNHTIWLLLRDGKWYSPKDISGLDRHLATPHHVAALEGKFLKLEKLPRSRQRSYLAGI
jgi:hypothetical protein